MDQSVGHKSNTSVQTPPAFHRATWRVAEGYVSLNPWRFSLLELTALTSCAALAYVLAIQAGMLLGFCFVVTVVSFRTSIIDFTLIGGLATLLTILFGTLGVALLVVWAYTW
jgi:hypothetical protein